MMQGPPQKGPKKFFALRAKCPYMASALHVPTPGRAFFSRAPTRRSTAAARCVAGGPGAEPLAFGNFLEFGALSTTRNLVCGYCAPSGTAPPALGADVGHACCDWWSAPLRHHQRLMRSQSHCSRPRVLATEGFPDPFSPHAHPPARNHHGHESPSPASGQTPWRTVRGGRDSGSREPSA